MKKNIVLLLGSLLSTGTQSFADITLPPQYEVTPCVQYVENLNPAPTGSLRQEKIIQCLSERLAAATNRLENILSAISVSPEPKPGYPNGKKVVFTQANIYIQNGDSLSVFSNKSNGLGNLIIGYNGIRGGGADIRTGSHNLIIGDRNNYAANSGFAVGYGHDVLAPFGAVVGGSDNKILETASAGAIVGGYSNKVSGLFGAALGGRNNNAVGEASTVSGGSLNAAFTLTSSISGGSQNLAFGESASIIGGNSNTTNGKNASISGGSSNSASGTNASISGGHGNTVAVGTVDAWVGGGMNKTATVAQPWVP